MNAPAVSRSPLWAFTEEERPVGDEVGVDVVEHAGQGYFNLRCDPGDGEIRQAVAGALGLELPLDANTVVYSEALAAYWLGPDEWLLRTASESDRGAPERVSQALEGRWFALTEISGGMTHVSIDGVAAEAVLSQGTTLDLHPRVFKAGHCAQTLLAKTNVILARADGSDTAFDVFVRRSFADYLFLFLRDAAHEYGFRFSRAPSGVSGE